MGKNMYKKQTRDKREQEEAQARENAPARSTLIPAVSSVARTPAQPLRSMEQERAEFALTRIELLKERFGADADTQDKVRNYLRSLPALIHMNGLGQALAFCRMKSQSAQPGQEKAEHHAYAQIYQMVRDWLCSPTSKGHVFTGHEDVLAAITRSDMASYMAAQNETQALLEWAKKFSVALLEQKKDKAS